MAITEALSISGAADAAGLSPHTLRYYERAGLMLERVTRASSTHRRYSEAERLALLEAHRRTVQAQLEASARNLQAIDFKISLYQERITT
jgi:hypothetical protein